MKKKKIPLRKCIGCQNQFDKKTLIRIVKNKQGEVFLDNTGRANGRGAYLCNKRSCLDMAVKRKAIARALEVAVSDDVISSLQQAIADETR